MKNRFRPQVDRIEERVVPTVLFTPVFGAETAFYTHGVPGIPVDYLNSPQIYPIFWGSYWQQNPAQAQDLAEDFNKLFTANNNAYLQGLTQYHTNGMATFYPGDGVDGPAIDGSNPPNNIGSAHPVWGALVPNSRDPIDAEVERVLDHPSNYGFNIPNPGHTAQAPIYVVITPPGVTGGDVGFNEPSDAGTFGYHEVVWVSTRWINSNDKPQGIDQNFSEHGFSHEVVEAMTDPFGPLGGTHISKGANWPANDGNSQICDKEPDGNYYYRVGGPNGVLAQAFWSQNDGGFNVPDGNSLVMDLTGNWNGPNDFLGNCA